MRSIKGYCMRQARREVYKAYMSYNKGQQQKQNEVVYKDDILGASIFLLILIIIIGLLIN